VGEVSGEPGCCVWLTGRRGAGKTTVARAVAAQLRRRGAPVAVVDESEVREHLGGTDPLDGLLWVARLVMGAGAIAVVAVDQPRRASREELRVTVPGFVEVFVDAGPGPDVYEEPYAPELRVPTGDRSPEASAAQVVSWLEDQGLVVGEPDARAQTRPDGRIPPSR
jgi:adenylylsulfate kinase-like enzyme